MHYIFVHCIFPSIGITDGLDERIICETFCCSGNHYYLQNNAQIKAVKTFQIKIPIAFKKCAYTHLQECFLVIEKSQCQTYNAMKK
jgi:hypothetical protein